MSQKQMSLEHQLRQYADGIVPDGYVGGRSAPNRRRRGPSSRTTWLAAAAAALVLVALAIGTRPNSAQRVNAGDFVQQPDDGSADTTPPAPVVAAPPPRPDDVPATGDMRTREEGLVVMMAQFVLVDECMAAQGFDVAMPTDQEWIELHGSWHPNGVLGIGTEGGARLLGYRSDGWGGAGSPTQAAAFQAMTPEEESAYVAALTDINPADTSPPVPGASPTNTQLQGPTPTPLPPGSGATTDSNGSGCWAVVEAALGDYQNREIAFDNILQFGADETQGERFRSDPALAAAITAWQDCVRLAVDVEADTPNTLARQFVFTQVEVTDREREIAGADARCQDEVSLDQAFYIARTKQVRLELGDDVTIFDDFVRFRAELLDLSQQVLNERGIVPPSLD